MPATPHELRPVGDPRRHATSGSRWVHRLSDATTHSAVSVGVLVAVLAWAVVGGFYDFPEWWTNTLYSVSAGVTLVMVFAIQHTQARLEHATQRKLDELLRSQPDADNRLIAAEIATDAELAEIAAHHLEAHERAVTADDRS